MLYSVMGGGVMLGAIFMATDYVTSPAMPAAQLVYGCLLYTSSPRGQPGAS